MVIHSSYSFIISGGSLCAQILSSHAMPKVFNLSSLSISQHQPLPEVMTAGDVQRAYDTYQGVYGVYVIPSLWALFWRCAVCTIILVSLLQSKVFYEAGSTIITSLCINANVLVPSFSQLFAVARWCKFFMHQKWAVPSSGLPSAKKPVLITCTSRTQSTNLIPPPGWMGWIQNEDVNMNSQGLADGPCMLFPTLSSLVF